MLWGPNLQGPLFPSSPAFPGTVCCLLHIGINRLAPTSSLCNAIASAWNSLLQISAWLVDLHEHPIKITLPPLFLSVPYMTFFSSQHLSPSVTFIISLPPLEGKPHKRKCFGFILYPQCLEWCLAHSCVIKYLLNGRTQIYSVCVYLCLYVCVYAYK